MLVSSMREKNAGFGLDMSRLNKLLLLLAA
jgi:hypothetical protein